MLWSQMGHAMLGNIIHSQNDLIFDLPLIREPFFSLGLSLILAQLLLKNNQSK